MTTKLKITGMSCEHCVSAVQKAISAVGGVSSVSIELTSGLASVDGEIIVADVVSAIEEEGYFAELIG